MLGDAGSVLVPGVLPMTETVRGVRVVDRVAVRDGVVGVDTQSGGRGRPGSAGHGAELSLVG